MYNEKQQLLRDSLLTLLYILQTLLLYIVQLNTAIPKHKTIFKPNVHWVLSCDCGDISSEVTHTHRHSQVVMCLVWTSVVSDGIFFACI